MMWAQKQKGFTIVELLIVVVVIAILAAITIVSFNGIQNNAHDSAVKSDLRNTGVKVQEYYERNQSYPRGGNTTTAFTNFGPLSFNKNAYLAGTNNVYYCTATVGGVERFGLAARSKSGNAFMYSSITGTVEVHSGSWAGSGAPCTATGVSTSEADFFYKYGVTSGNVWNGWVQ